MAAFKAPPLSAFFRKEEDNLVTQGLTDVHGVAMFHSLYDVGDLIGRGAFSLVYLCRRKETQQIFAVKVINKALCVKKKTLRDEITVLLRVKHANIISLEEVYESDQELLLVMERVTGGELFDRIVRVLNGEGYDSKVDLWSLGVVLYIMLCGFPPFSEDENGLESVYLKIRSGVLDFPHPYWTNVSDGAKDLIRNLLNVSAQDRFSAAQALNHPWIKGEYSEQPLSSAIMEMKRFNQKRRFN
ncbi:hypothetical protein JG688_00011801 [Phytophthora aleatoria]|uniref:Protein kinase domain-containing protein n=1 Tax=Phytophthora aleatoria TaxID=2496075 RepID=A0A8J5M519_9STRA|nr:hypothetical protein JG688_00011801 [Phytophthora aleatoria]